jgi:uncharacterized protein (TIGR00297 family)
MLMTQRALARRSQLGLGAVTLLLCLGAVLLLPLDSILSGNLLTGAFVTLVFALLAWGMGGVDGSGALAGAAVSLALFAGAGLPAFLVLVSVFAVTWASTRLGTARKQELHLARDAGGRSATQVLANLMVAAVLVVASAVMASGDLLLIAAVAALAEAAADTASSECGEALAGQARLITTMRPVPVGTDGAVSLPGTLAAVAAVAIVATISVTVGLIPRTGVAPVMAAALAGTFLDSILGATLERRRLLGNDAVNLLSTLAAALVALGLVRA